MTKNLCTISLRLCLTFLFLPSLPAWAENPAVDQAMASIQAAIPTAQADSLRPVFHFRPPAQWMNDINGPIYYNNYYHIFYQHNPYGDQWGNMHWGHARSRDLVSWEHLPVALWPSKEKGEEACFSGCSVINPAGEPMLFYTSIGHPNAQQWVALPADENWLTWKKHPDNPILTEALHSPLSIPGWRDPFIFTHENQYFMVIGGGAPKVLLYQAENEKLTQWKYRGILFENPDPNVTYNECPIFFPLGQKWILIIAHDGIAQYFTGSWDAASGKFLSEKQGLINHGKNFYAPTCMKDQNGNWVLLGWWLGYDESRGGWPQNKGWNGCMTLPRFLTLAPDLTLQQQPIPQLQSLRNRHLQFNETEIDNRQQVFDLGDLPCDTLEILARFQLNPQDRFTLDLFRSADGTRTLPITYENDELNIDGIKIPLPLPNDGQLCTLHVFRDKSVLEIFVNQQLCIARVISPPNEDRGLAFSARDGKIRLKSLDLWQINPVWP